MLHLIVLTFVALAGAVSGASFDELNSKIDWMDWEGYKKLDLSKNEKPIMYVLTQPWCGACKGLKKSFVSNGDKLVDMSSKYVMVSVDGDDNNKEDLSPDGKYIPRIFFASPDGKVHPEFTKPGATQYKYFYSDASQVASAMEKFLENPTPAPANKEEL